MHQGYSVALSGDAATVVTGVYNDSPGQNVGHARVFRYSGGGWSQIGNDIDGEAPEDYSVTRATPFIVPSFGSGGWLIGACCRHFRRRQYSGHWRH
jgi:hypothetical protein